MSRRQQQAAGSGSGAGAGAGAGGGVYIADDNGLRGDIVAKTPGDEKKMVVKLRGSNGKELAIDDEELIEYTKDHSPEQPKMKEEESFRFHLYHQAQNNPSAFYLEERVKAVELGDEFTFLVLSNSDNNDADDDDDAVADEPLPTDIAGQALVRLVEAYFTGQGTITAKGRHTMTFRKLLSPFWTEKEIEHDHDNKNCHNEEDDKKPCSEFVKLKGETPVEIFDTLEEIFSTSSVNGLIFFRAFCYAQQRLDYHRQDDDSLLDAYCVTFFTLQKLLRGRVQPDNSINNNTQQDYEDLIENEFTWYRSHNIYMTVDDLAWCYCNLLLRIGSDIRRYMRLEVYNQILPQPLGLTISEELLIAQMGMELRPESPVSFLSAYKMIMETKTLVPAPLRAEWMEFAYDYALRGLDVADRLRDPFFQYTFHLIVAYWIPTTSHAPTSYSFKEIKTRLFMANQFKLSCCDYLRDYMFWFGRQHEIALIRMLRLHPIDPDMELSIPLLDAYTYSPLHLKREPEHEKQEHEKQSPPPGEDNSTSSSSTTATAATTATTASSATKHGPGKSIPVTAVVNNHRNNNGGNHNSRNGNRNGHHHHHHHHHEERKPQHICCGNCKKSLQRPNTPSASASNHNLHQQQEALKKKKFTSCPSCDQIYYCNRKCQLQHWKNGHKHICRRKQQQQEEHAG